MIRLFLDSEWANDALRELVSLALISEDGEHVFYSERDPLPGMPSSFTRERVYPLLNRGEAAMKDSAMTHALRSFLGPLGDCEIFADAPLDFSMLSQVWNGRDRTPPGPPFRTRLAREGNLMPSVERYFEFNAAQGALRHHALVDAMALRSAWIVENYSFDGDVGDATSHDPHYDDWLQAKVRAARADPRPSIPHEVVMETLRRRLEATRAKKHDD
ncbi:3'-5' exoribonuclease [Pseudoxanthomonas mexicana]|uniref:3'-5' exoribonuclease n=1 Tax=Pseudoxanthomonas mexicana TaxID=128785 RepID=A0ABX6R8L3_PSEMX|nr:3'-5' exoribonuclease [Pseudoxanthomonas mexicana]QND79615.1 3'-5' exoribonuclease [Pseudoxanthomonas mexicana]